MSTLKLEERKENVKDSLDVVLGNDIRGKTVLLVDDVETSGTSMREARRMLIGSGAQKVIFMALGLTRSPEIEDIKNGITFTGD